jgi:hypothetical protein
MEKIISFCEKRRFIFIIFLFLFIPLLSIPVFAKVVNKKVEDYNIPKIIKLLQYQKEIARQIQVKGILKVTELWPKVTFVNGIHQSESSISLSTKTFKFSFIRSGDKFQVDLLRRNYAGITDNQISILMPGKWIYADIPIPTKGQNVVGVISISKPPKFKFPELLPLLEANYYEILYDLENKNSPIFSFHIIGEESYHGVKCVVIKGVTYNKFHQKVTEIAWLDIKHGFVCIKNHLVIGKRYYMDLITSKLIKYKNHWFPQIVYRKDYYAVNGKYKLYHEDYIKIANVIIGEKPNSTNFLLKSLKTPPNTMVYDRIQKKNYPFKDVK